MLGGFSFGYVAEEAVLTLEWSFCRDILYKSTLLVFEPRRSVQLMCCIPCRASVLFSTFYRLAFRFEIFRKEKF